MTGQLVLQVMMRRCCNDHFFHLVLKLNRAKSFMFSCSARLLKISCCKTSGVNNPLQALRNVFLLWLKAVFTRLKKTLRLLICSFSFRGNNFITPLFTLGGGV